MNANSIVFYLSMNLYSSSRQFEVKVKSTKRDLCFKGGNFIINILRTRDYKMLQSLDYCKFCTARVTYSYNDEKSYLRGNK